MNFLENLIEYKPTFEEKVESIHKGFYPSFTSNELKKLSNKDLEAYNETKKYLGR